MPIRYLNTSAVSGSSSTSTFTNIPYPVTISNLTPSTSTVSGALVVAGGIGTSGNIYLANLVASGNISAFSGSFTGYLNAGIVTTSRINNSGEITSSSANIGILGTTNITGGDASFEDVVISGTLDTNIVTGNTISFAESIIGPTGAFTTLSTTDLNVNTVSTNFIQPSDIGYIDLGNLTQLRISGGAYGQVLSTDGNGNLTWSFGADQLEWGYGLQRNGQTVSLTQSGVAPGIYNSVNVDAYGRVLAGYSTVQGINLQTVTDNGSSTTHAISISNTTDATDTYIGALTVAGGVGVGATLFTESLQVVNSALFNRDISVATDATINETLFLKGQTSGVVPVKFDSASLVGSPTVGALEFTGSNLYITTDSGRKLVVIRETDASPIIVVRAITTYNIDLLNPQQTIVDGGNTVNAWDGLTLYPDDKVLLTGQTDASENGVYIWTSSGVALTRSNDFDNARGVLPGAVFSVSEGNINAGTIWTLDTPSPISIGTTGLSFSRKVSKDVKSIANLSTTQTGFLARTSFGSITTRSISSGHSFLTVSNGNGVSGDITLNIGTLPVNKGGTGRTNITGYMKGVGTAITSLASIPYTDISGLGTIVTQNSNNVNITGGTVTVSTLSTSNLTASSASITSLTSSLVNANTVSVTDEVTTKDLNVTGQVNIPNLKGNIVLLGTNTQGNFESNAANLSVDTSVTDSIAVLNSVLGKLIPPPPPRFPGQQTLEILNTENRRVANFTQTDYSSTQDQNVPGGTTISVVRSSSYSTNTIANVWPGETGTISAFKDGTKITEVVLSDNDDSGTYSDLTISNDRDYHELDSSIAAGFWDIFDSKMSGTVVTGWHDVSISHELDGTNNAYWYADLSDPGIPIITNKSMTPSSTALSYSSTVPHYTDQTTFVIAFNVNRLSGDTYPINDEFITSTSGGAFSSPGNFTYTNVGIATPLARNLYVTSGSASVNVDCNIVSGFGLDDATYGPVLTVDNGYHTVDEMFTPTAKILYKTGTDTAIDETSISVADIGIGSGNGRRIVNPGSGDIPVYTGEESVFNSQTSTLEINDATVVGSILKNDNTDYSVGYLPSGPDLSGRALDQYFTFKFSRAAISKFDIKYSGTLAGAWVALPGSQIDTTASTTNGWLPLTESYIGAGIPGVNGNGYNGCAVGGVLPVNTEQVEKSITVTFGTETSSNATNNNIYIRLKLSLGQQVTALSIEEATN